MLNYDIAFGVIILVSAAIALFRGGITEILSIAAWLLAIFIMHKFSTEFMSVMPQTVSNLFIRKLGCFMLAFIASSIIMALVKKILYSMMRSIGLNGLDVVLGLFFGIARGVIICAVFVIILSMLKLDQDQQWKNTLCAPLIAPIVSILIENLPVDILSDKISKTSSSNNVISSGAEIFSKH